MGATADASNVTDASDAADAVVWPPAHTGFIAELTTDVCFGDCPVYTVRVRWDGAFVLTLKSPRKGCITGTAPLDKVGKIEALARSANYLTMKAVYETTQHDRRWITTAITDTGKTHSVRRWGYKEGDAAYANLVAIENAIEDATSSSKLSESGALVACPSGK